MLIPNIVESLRYLTTTTIKGKI